MRYWFLLLFGFITAIAVATLSAYRWNDLRIDAAFLIAYVLPVLSGWIARSGSAVQRLWGIVLFSSCIVLVWSLHALTLLSPNIFWIWDRLRATAGPVPLAVLGTFLLSWVCAVAGERLLRAKPGRLLALELILVGAPAVLLTILLAISFASHFAGWGPESGPLSPAEYRVAYVRTFLGMLIRLYLGFWYISVPFVFSLAYGILMRRSLGSWNNRSLSLK
jgi:hypothetical protein